MRVRPRTTAWLIVVLLAIVVAGVLYWDRSSSTPGPSLPAVIGDPPLWADQITTSPIGAASVAYSSPSWYADGQSGDLAIVGSATDSYRYGGSTVTGIPGQSVLLSPDGTRLATATAVVNLQTGAITPYPELPSTPPTNLRKSTLEIHPQVWSPDGHYLVLARWLSSSGGVISVPSLFRLDTRTGKVTKVANLTRTDASFDGWIAAYSPDGTRLAVQAANTITIYGKAGVVSQFPVPAQARIAGKGAWTPNGKAIELAVPSKCTECYNDVTGAKYWLYPATWQMYAVNSITGDRQGPTYGIDDIITIRMLGWWPDGHPIVEGRYPSADGNAWRRMANPRFDPASSWVSANIIALSATAAPTVVLAPLKHTAQAIDVADNAIAGGTVRRGSTPLLSNARVHVVSVVAIRIVILAVIVLIGYVLYRLYGRRHPAAGVVTSPGESDHPDGSGPDTAESTATESSSSERSPAP